MPFLWRSPHKQISGPLTIANGGTGGSSPDSARESLSTPYAEAGTWTPVMLINGSATTASTATGRYTKIGDLIYYRCLVILTDNGSGSGDVTITGLPFTAAFAAAGRAQLTSGGSSATGIYPNTVAGAATLQLYMPGATADTAASETEVTNTFGARLIGFYFTDD